MRKSIILILNLLVGLGALIAQNRHLEDSLRAKVMQMSDIERLAYLDKQMYASIPNDTRLVYAHLLYEEGKRQKNEAIEAEAILILAKHFYSYNADSMRYWISKAEPLFPRIGRTEDLCRMKGWDIFQLNREGKQEEALQAVEALKALSRELSFVEGFEMADMALGDFYFSNKMFKEAEETYLSVLRRMKEREAPIVREYYVIRQLFNRMPDMESRLRYLQMAEKILTKCKEEGLKYLDPENPISNLEYVLHRNYAREYLNVNQLDEGWSHLQIAQQITDENNLSYTRSELATLYADYYIKIEEYKKAMDYIDILIQTGKTRGLLTPLDQGLRFKSTALSGMGYYHDAYLTAQELIALRDSINRNNFNKVLAELRTKHEVEKLQIESQQMEAKAKQEHIRLTFWYAGSLVLLLVFLILLYMVYMNNRKKAEIKAAKEKAEEIDNLKTTFLSHINNEIRNPLNAIVGFSDILIDEEDQETRLQYAQIIEENNELLQCLIADVLDISKIESGSMVLFPTEQDISLIMRKVYDEMKPLVSGSVEFVLKDCPPLVMTVDKNRLTQIIKNILKNAIKYTEQGYISFGYLIEDRQVKFFVEDTGKGISEEQLENLFDRFAQFSKKKGGTSLGLAISKGLAIAMGGDISVKSEFGKGSIFYINIPYSD